MSLSFEQRQYLRHAISEARKAQIPKRPDTCPQCGTHKNNRTQGCKACVNRHYKRALRREATQPTRHQQARTNRVCVGCGVPYNQHTPGCIRCYERSRKEIHREREAA